MKNRVCNILNIEKPVIQGPMLWVTSAEMVAAVSEAGGLGTLGINAGYKTRVFTVEETAERFRLEVQKTKKLTKKPFAFNCIISEEIDPYSKACLQVAYEEGLKHVVAVGGTSEKAIKELKEHNMIIIARPSYPSVEAAKKLEKAGADIIVATGFDEGGCAPSNPIGTFSIVPIISDAVEIPVLAAGGIVDSRGVKASLILGAEGIFAGTVFITSVEGPAADITKEAIINYESTDTLAIRTPYGYERCLPTKIVVDTYSKQAIASPDDSAERLTQTYLEGFINGELDKGFISVGASISQINKIKTCEKIIDELFDNVSF